MENFEFNLFIFFLFSLIVLLIVSTEIDNSLSSTS